MQNLYKQTKIIIFLIIANNIIKYFVDNILKVPFLYECIASLDNVSHIKHIY